MLENKIFGMISLGCDKNRVDAERLLAIVRGRGFAVPRFSAPWLMPALILLGAFALFACL